MNIQQEIDQREVEIHRLQCEIRELERKQLSCRHKWGEAYQDYDQKVVPIQENRPRGSDYFNPVIVGWETKTFPVWRRKCSICGKTYATTETESVGVRPVFKNGI